MIPFIDIIVNLDQYLNALIAQYGLWVYLVVFLIVLIETGVVIFPFLPGDSLLFVAGALAATGSLDIISLFIILSAAAIIGDTINYQIGNHIGRKAFEGRVRFLKKEHLEKAEAFYEKHGGKTIIIARFIPFIRTFAPFVAGIGKMKYPRFLGYNVIGGMAWVFAFLAGGYFFGNIPIIRDNLGFVLVGIVVATVLAALIGFLREMGNKKKQ
jgi:membrane-associated protein